LGRIEAAALGYIARTKTQGCDFDRVCAQNKQTRECDLIAFVRKTNKHENAI
jgi:hypothetical protein